MQDSPTNINPEAKPDSDNALLIFSILSLPLLYLPIALIWGNRTAPIVSLVLVLFVVIPLLLSKYPKTAFYALFCYIPFSGTVTYALGGHPALPLISDVLYLAALIGVIRHCQKEKQPLILPQAIKAPLGLVFSIGILTIAFTNLPDQVNGIDGALPLIMGAWGLKVLLGYALLVACTYYLIRTEKDFYFLMRLQVVLILIACTVGAIQFLQLKTGVCAGTQGEGEELLRASLNARCFVGGSLLYSPEVGAIKLPGTFAAPWQWGWFLMSSVFFSFCTAFRDRALLWRALGSGAIALAIAMLVISGQGLMTLLLLPSVLFLMVATGQISNLKQVIPISLLLGGGLLYLGLSHSAGSGDDTPSLLSSLVSSLVSQWQFRTEVSLPEQFSYVWRSQEGFFGHGLGRATNSARAYGKTVLMDTYHPKLLYELGPWGLVSVLVLHVTVFFSSFKAYRSINNPRLKAYAAAMWGFVVLTGLFPFVYPLEVTPVNIYFWVAVGLTLKLSQLSAISANNERV